MPPLRWRWRNLRVILLRAHKDRRARRALFYLFYMVLYIAFYAIYFIRNPGYLIAYLVLAPFVAGGL